jgi:hypothetical protein
MILQHKEKLVPWGVGLLAHGINFSVYHFNEMFKLWFETEARSLI